MHWKNQAGALISLIIISFIAYIDVQGSCEWRDESKRCGWMIGAMSAGKNWANPYICLGGLRPVTPIGVENMMEKQSAPKLKPTFYAPAAEILFEMTWILFLYCDKCVCIGCLLTQLFLTKLDKSALYVKQSIYLLWFTSKSWVINHSVFLYISRGVAPWHSQASGRHFWCHHVKWSSHCLWCLL